MNDSDNICLVEDKKARRGGNRDARPSGEQAPGSPVWTPAELSAIVPPSTPSGLLAAVPALTEGPGPQWPGPYEF
jgi:hypothetical protein